MHHRFLPGVPSSEIEEIYNAAPGKEIASGKFDSPESSAALAANTFGFFLNRPGDLPPLPGCEDAEWPSSSLGGRGHRPHRIENLHLELHVRPVIEPSKNIQCDQAIGAILSDHEPPPVGTVRWTRRVVRTCPSHRGGPSEFPATPSSSGRADPSLPSLCHSTSQTPQVAQPLVAEGSVGSPWTITNVLGGGVVLGGWKAIT